MRRESLVSSRNVNADSWSKLTLRVPSTLILTWTNFDKFAPWYNIFKWLHRVTAVSWRGWSFYCLRNRCVFILDHLPENRTKLTGNNRTLRDFTWQRRKVTYPSNTGKTSANPSANIRKKSLKLWSYFIKTWSMLSWITLRNESVFRVNVITLRLNHWGNAPDILRKH